MSTATPELSDSELLSPASPSRALAPISVLGGGLGPASSVYGPKGPEILHAGFNQTWLMNCLRRRWLLASLMGLLLGAACSGLLLWLFPETSQITSYLEVKSDDDSSLNSKDARPKNPADVARENMSHLALIRSPFVLEAAFQAPGIAQLEAVQSHPSDKVLWMLEELKVSFPNDGEILEVRYEGEEPPEDMKKLIDAIVKAYQDKVLLEERVLAEAGQDDMAAVLDEMNRQLQNKLDNLKQMGISKGILSEDVELPKIQRDIQTFTGLVEEVRKELTEIEVNKRIALQAAQSPAALDQAIQFELEKDPMIANYKQQLFAIEQQIQTKQSMSRNPNNSELKRYMSMREQTAAQMESYRTQFERTIREKLQNVPNEGLRAAMVEYQIRYEDANKRLAEYEEKLAEAESRLKEMGVGDPEYKMLESNVENDQIVIAELQQKIAEYKIDKNARERGSNRASGFEKVHVIQKATATEQINKVERWSIAGIGGIAGLALTAYGVGLMEFRRRRLNSPDDVEEGLGIRVLGSLPSTSLKGLTGRSLVAAQLAESIDNVRAIIMRGSAGQPRQVVLVTAPGTQEGTTIVASSLALSLARSGRRTLLVDADVRSPSLHKLFGMSLEDGLCEVLRAQLDVADAVRPTNNENLYLLTAGLCDLDAIHALATDQPQAIFEKMRDQFDFIILDAAPILEVSEVLALAHNVDGAVLSVLRDHSQVPAIHQAAERLRGLGIQVIGAVVNGVPTKADRRVVQLHQSTNRSVPKLEAAAAETEA